MVAALSLVESEEQVDRVIPQPKVLSLRESDIKYLLTLGVINKSAYILLQMWLRYGVGDTPNFALDDFGVAVSVCEIREDGTEKIIDFKEEDVNLAIAQLAKKKALSSKQVAVQLNIYSV